MEVEIWKPVGGFENYYECSSFGRTKRLSVVRPMISKGGGITERYYAEKILSPQSHINKYMFLNLSKDGKVYYFSVSRLIACHFVSNPENKEQVNHIDGDVTNNRADNLEWVSPSENIQHSYDVLNRPVVRSGESRMGNKSKQSKPVLQYSSTGELLKEYASAGEAARSLSISQSQISLCCVETFRRAKGFKFQYKC